MRSAARLSGDDILRRVDPRDVDVDTVRTALERGATLHQTTNVVLVAAVKRVHFEEYDTAEAVRLLLENGSLVFARGSEHCPLCVALACCARMSGNAPLADYSSRNYFVYDHDRDIGHTTKLWNQEGVDSYMLVQMATRTPTRCHFVEIPISPPKMEIMRQLLRYYAHTHLFGELWFVQSHAAGCLTSACLFAVPDLLDDYATAVGNAVRHHCNILLQQPVLFGQYVAAWVYAVRSIMYSVIDDVVTSTASGYFTRCTFTTVTELVVAIIRNIPAPLELCPENEDALMHVCHAIDDFGNLLYREGCYRRSIHDKDTTSLRMPAIIRHLLSLLPAGCGPMLNAATRNRANRLRTSWNCWITERHNVFWLLCARGMHYVRTGNDAVCEDQLDQVPETLLSIMYARGAASDGGIAARGGGPISLQELAAAAVPAAEVEEAVRAGTVPHCVRHLLAWWTA